MASVVATAIIGGASGLLQVPTMARDIETLKTSKELSISAAITLGERVRSSELIVEAINRRLGEISNQLTELDRKRDSLSDSLSRFKETYITEHIALEGRSKDRHTEAMGALNGLKASDAALRDRQEAFSQAMQQIRGQLLDIATRVYRGPEKQSLPPLAPPVDPNRPFPQYPNSPAPQVPTNQPFPTRRAENNSGQIELRARDQRLDEVTAQGQPASQPQEGNTASQGNQSQSEGSGGGTTHSARIQ